MDFEFDRLGCRIPAILVSAHTAGGSIFNANKQATSLLATLEVQFGLEPLTERDAHSPTIFEAFNLASPRPASTWPATKPLWQSPNPEAVPHPAVANPHHQLTEPAKGLIGLLYARFGTAEEKRTEPQTFADAYNALQKYGVGLFGVPKNNTPATN